MDNNSSSIVPCMPDAADIRNRIFVARGQQVMIDRDLAALYGVETKVFNQAVKRNANRFPERFRFQLTKEENDTLRSQTVTSNGRGGRRYPPYVFTEAGIAMLSSVLRSEMAVEISVRIMDTFVEMRHFLASNAQLFKQVEKIERRQVADQAHNDERFDRIFGYIEEHVEPAQRIFFDGQVYDAFELLVKLVQQAEREIVLIDGYVDVGTLNILAKKNERVKITLWTGRESRLSKTDVDTFNSQYPTLEVRRTSTFHDRFMLLDGKTGYHIGASLKDAGKKSFAINRIEDEALIRDIIIRLEG